MTSLFRGCGRSHITTNTATFAMMRNFIAGGSGPGPKENPDVER
jgi:hypothetical protein